MKTSDPSSVNISSSTLLGVPSGTHALNGMRRENRSIIVSVRKSLSGLAGRGLVVGAARAAKVTQGLFNRRTGRQGSPPENTMDSAVPQGDLAIQPIRTAVEEQQIIAAERRTTDFGDHGVLSAVREVMFTNPILVDLLVSNDPPTSAQSASVSGAEMLFENGLISQAQFDDLLRGQVANTTT
jgi:hypothetical protein